MDDIQAWILTLGGLIGAITAIVAVPWGAIKGIRAYRRRRRRAAAREDERLVGATEDVRLELATKLLARTTAEQWRKEAIRLGLIARQSDPGTTGPAASLIQIGWSIDDRMPIHADGSTNDRLAAWRDNPGVDRLAEFFHASPSRAMVILGTPQAGKSAAAVLLTLGLLDKRTADAPAVPVKFSLANWDHEVSLEEWLTQRLLDDHVGFRNTERYGEKVVTRLLHNRRVLPILDGLDELPGKGDVSEHDERQRVVNEINKSELELPGLILTCQKEIYDHLDHRLHDAVTVTLQGVPRAEAWRYIKNASLDTKNPQRWAPVLDSLHSDEPTALATALASPLMVYLVPEVYKDPDSTPAELLHGKYKGHRKAIENHLLRAFVPAVFSEYAADRRWRSKDAERWLGHLATQLEKPRKDQAVAATRFGWWDLSWYGRPQTAILAGAVGALAGGGAVGLAFTALFNGPVGLAVGAGAGLVLGYLSGRNPPPKPSDTQRRNNWRFGSILKSGVAIGIIVFVIGALARNVYLGVFAGLWFGIPIALLYGLTEPDPTLRPLDAGLLLRRDVKVGITFGLTYGLPASITGWLLSGDPVLSALIGIFAGLAGALLYGPIWIFAALASMGGAWKKLEAVGVVAFVHLAIAIVRFAPFGKLPWRVMAFLDRAHELGVLRMVSGSYEFRHKALQEVLAAEYAGSAGMDREERPLAPPAVAKAERSKSVAHVEPIETDAERP